MKHWEFREWLRETHGAYFELVRHFFLRLFDTDLVSTPGQLQNLIIGILSAICSMSMLVPVSLFRKYIELTVLPDDRMYHLHAMSDRLMFTIVPMILVGFVTAMLWQQLFPADRDYLILIPLPISRLQMFSAKFSALALFAGLFVVAINAFPSVILPAIQSTKYAIHQAVFADVFAHALATSAGALFVFFALVGLRGLLMNVLGKRLFPQVSLLLQALLLLALLTMLPQVFELTGMYRRGLISYETMLLTPPFWFHAMYEGLIGRHDAKLAELARRGWQALGIAGVSTVLLYWLSYQRQASMQAESEKRLPLAGVEAGFRWLLRMVRSPYEERAMVSFILKTLARSRQHKLLLSAYIGIGVAILVNMYIVMAYDARLLRRAEYRQEEMIHTALSAPLVLSFFLLSGMRVVFSIPVSLQANWVFRLLEGEQRRVWLDAVEAAFYLLCIAPVVVVAPLFLAPVMGWGYVPEHLVVCVLLSMILAEMMLWEWQKVPFVCSYLPGKKNVALLFLLYWMAFGIYAFTTTRFEMWCLREPSRLLILIGLLLAAFAKIREGRREHWGALPLLYEDQIEPLVATLGIERR